jgi:hypothetical protein
MKLHTSMRVCLPTSHVAEYLAGVTHQASTYFHACYLLQLKPHWAHSYAVVLQAGLILCYSVYIVSTGRTCINICVAVWITGLAGCMCCLLLGRGLQVDIKQYQTHVCDVCCLTNCTKSGELCLLLQCDGCLVMEHQASEPRCSSCCSARSNLQASRICSTAG